MYQKIEKVLPQIKKNVSLRNYTSFKIGGPAKYFFEAKNKKALIKTILVAKRMGLPFFILGGGSNILVADKGYNGLVIKIKNQRVLSRKRKFSGNLKIKNINQKSKIIKAGAGTSLSQLATSTFKNNVTGLEWAIGIPGTVGGMIYGNAGALGRTIGEVVDEVEVYDIKNQKIKIFRNKDCKFGYRDTIFKHKKGDLIILSTTLKLKKGDKKEIKNKIQKNLEQRKKTQPLNFPSAGSIFKNLPGLSAGELIEKCNLKEKKIGRVKISEKHANFIVNLGGGKAKHVKKLINLIKKRVKNKFGIVLEEEIEIL